MIYNENDKVLHIDGTELIIVGRAFRILENKEQDIIYKCFSLTTQNIVNINEKDIKGFKTPKSD